MQLHCEHCFTPYKVPDKGSPSVGCPYCGYVNEAKSSSKETGPDQSKTMLNFLEGELQGEISEVKRLIAGKLPLLEPGHEIFVEILEGQRKGHRFAVRKPKISLGRKGSDIQMSDPEVSRRHCVIAAFRTTLILRDLGSSNGTMVNRFLVKEAILKPTDRIRIGETVLMVSLRKII